MNIGIVTPQLARYGGSEIYLLECLKRWQHVAELTVYTANFRRRLFDEFGIDRRVRVIPLARPPRRSRFGLLHETVVMPRIWEREVAGTHDLYFLYLFPTQMIRRSPSIWFAAEPLRMLYDLRHLHAPLGRKLDVHLYPKIDYERMAVSDLDVLLELIERFDQAAPFDRLATNSLSTARYLKNVYGRAPDRIAYPGINLREPRPMVPGTEKILFVGNLWKHKRVDLVIRALALLDRGTLTIVGEGPERGRLERLARRLGVRSRVRFQGSITNARREALYDECLCCVYAPLREPFGMVPLEAAAAARPVVAAIGGGYGEILTDEAACLVPAHERKIAEAVRGLLDDPARARRMGEAGRALVQECTWDRTADVLLELFRETHGRRSRRQRPSARRTALGAHYYPWYRAGARPEHWNENTEHGAITDWPVGGPYTSTDRRMVRRHLGMALDAGLDFLVVNWQVTHAGLNPTELEATRLLFREVERERLPLSLSILLAVGTEDPAVLAESLRTLRSEFLPSPAFHRVRRKALLWYFVNDPLLGFAFHHLDALRELNRGCHPLATGALAYSRHLPRLLRDFFAGWCLYSPLEVGSRKARQAIWRRSYHDFCEDRGSLRLFSISPGYDDRALTTPHREKNRWRVVDRDGGRTYEEMQRFALELSPAPDLVVVTSFNEFHENTHIEPSDGFGRSYLERTREFAARLREGSEKRGRRNGVTISPALEARS